jgi:hypothetical protein
MLGRHLYAILRFSSLIAGCVVLGYAVGHLHGFSARRSPEFLTNEALITGFEDTLDPSRPMDVFRLVYHRLGTHVTVYPSENYYYFVLFCRQGVLRGNLQLSPQLRDRQEISFAYSLDGQRGGRSTTVRITREQGLFLARLNRFNYAAFFEGRPVLFSFHQMSTQPPAEVNFMSGETPIGPSFDESGLSFYLVFQKYPAHFFWILNEHAPVPDVFHKISDDVELGARTSFAFFKDHANSRKILIGVSTRNIEANTWYDGPFDQLPDNYIAAGAVEVKKYMEEVYPYTRGQIDQFGHFLLAPELRVLIAPYKAFERPEDMAFVEKCKTSFRTPPELYACITPDPQLTATTVTRGAAPQNALEPNQRQNLRQ